MKIIMSFLRYSFLICILLLPLTKLGATELEVITIQIPGKRIFFNMIKIPVGSFMKGSDSNVDEDADGDEEPAEQIMIEKAFYIGKFEVTQELWESVTGNNPSYIKNINHPVEQVTWKESIRFFESIIHSVKTRYLLQ